ncbi:MAG: hypothetical protein ACXVPU_18915, partial [Bacteroidia bacterium]
CTKFWNDGDVHKYFSPFDSPYDAYMYFMNVFSDLESTLKDRAKKIKVKIKPGRPLTSDKKVNSKNRPTELILQI